MRDHEKEDLTLTEQIGYALRQVEPGKTVAEICRELGISQQTFYRWRRKSRGMGVAELNRLKELERENKRLGATRP